MLPGAQESAIGMRALEYSERDVTHAGRSLAYIAHVRINAIAFDRVCWNVSSNPSLVGFVVNVLGVPAFRDASAGDDLNPSDLRRPISILRGEYPDVSEDVY